ncbi:MAG: hypothetical protein PHZ00_02050 [Candidatus Peribacteraceae bacterium]|nr:hypothetical protein [Candidatus Peribacteraceae bacterium]
MLDAGLPIELGLICVWIVGIVLSTVKYLRAWKQGKVLDQWIWFFVWCVFVTAASTVVLVGWDVLTRF